MAMTVKTSTDRFPPDFQVTPADLSTVGQGLRRPECVLASSSGMLYTSDAGGGVACLAPDGTLTRIGCGDRIENAPIKPNGIALQRDGSFLVANLDGGVYRLTREGALSPYLLEVDGGGLEVANFVMVDRQERIWITVSTRLQPRALAYRPGVDDGYIVLVDGKGARIVADGLGFTNECVLTPDGRHLFAIETFSRRLTRYDVGEDGALTGRSTVTEFGTGTFPDGLALDEADGMWVTSVLSNRVLRVTPDGESQLILEESDPDHLARVEEAYLAGGLNRDLMDNIPTPTLRSTSSLAFTGSDRRTAVLGVLLGDRLPSFRVPVPGVAPAHWAWGG